MNLSDAIRDFQLVPPVDPKVVEGTPMAERPASLGGARLAILDNRKGNANVLLTALGEQLRTRHGIADVTRYEKPIFSRPSPSELLDDLVSYDVVVTAIGD